MNTPMNMIMFSTHPTDRRSFEAATAALPEADRPVWSWQETRLCDETADLAEGHDGVCAFPNDELDKACLQQLHKVGVRLVAMRSAGYNNVDIKAAKSLGICVARVPAYSPSAVAEHAVALMLALNRKLMRAHARVREGNFSLEGLLGFDMNGKTVGVVGTGKIGLQLARILHGFGCKLLLHDPYPNQDAAALGRYVGQDELLARSDIVSLHCPLTRDSRHMINRDTIATMKQGVMLINTSRGALLDTDAAIQGLGDGRIGYLGLDVYEEEETMFFEDRSDRGIDDQVFARLLTWPNVLITAHQAYFTATAVNNIAATTLHNIVAFAKGACQNEIT